MFKKLIESLAGSPYQRELKRYREAVAQTAEHGQLIAGYDDEQIKAETIRLKERVAAHVAGITDKDELKAAEQEILDELLPEAFAVVREAAARTIGLRHFDVQIIGGMVLHEGRIAEMRTGEGKTLVATLPAYLNALTGRGVHVVTVNDYLARRDGGWMGPVYHALGLSVGAIGKENFSAVFDPDYVDPTGDLEDERLVHWRPTLRRECYRADITYGTSTEFGFDYLRDNTAIELARTVQGEHVFAIVDEVDSVLIDSARTPLIISGPAAAPSQQYQRFAEMVEKARLRRNTTNLDEDEEPDGDYVLDERTRSVSLTEAGLEKIENQMPEINLALGQSIYDPQFIDFVHYLENALKAKFTFKRDKDYIVQNGKVILIDQTTGRPMPSRRYSEGLHQAIEAKEGVRVQREDMTIATITVQNYFRLYGKLAGMTGTALTQAEEFDQVYKLDVVPIPTNVEYRAENGEFQTREQKEEGVPVISYLSEGEARYFKRVDYPDQVYLTEEGKFTAVASEIAELVDGGRPILVGTGSVEASEYLSEKLRQLNLPHEVLNAKNHQREALIVAQAGRPGMITISTSMAGRGTDILLGGNAEGLAAKMLANRCFTMNSLKEVVAQVVQGSIDAARQRAAADIYLGEEIIPWIEEANQELARKTAVEDIVAEVIKELREDRAYADISFDLITRIVREIDLGMMIDRRRLEKARELIEQNDLSTSLIPEVQFRLNEYRQLSGLQGQDGLIDVLTRRLYEKHYNARAALIRAVQDDDLEEAQRLTQIVPALPASLIADIQTIRAECESERSSVWQQGGLHVIGTERHESRRIDDQLRGRAARQGDPGSSRFYLSLEDELMMRFGGERTKRIMERLNVPEDMPIATNMLSNVIEQAQAKFEAYNFEIRKNLVEYDEAVNAQRQIVYDERNAILRGDDAGLDALVRRFYEETVTRFFARYADNFEAWALAEIESAIEDYANFETGAVNTRAVLGRVLNLFPRLDTEDLDALRAITDGDELVAALRERVLEGIEQGHNLRILYAEIARSVPLWPVVPPPLPNGPDRWDSYLKQVYALFDHYRGDILTDDTVEALRAQIHSSMEKALRDCLAEIRSGAAKPKEIEARYYTQIDRTLADVFYALFADLENEELTEAIIQRVDALLEIARLEPQPASAPAEANGSWPLDRQVFAIGAEQIGQYERALMLSVIDADWRQYLTAIDSLRQGIGLAAYGQRDPKVEFKRRAFEMFEQLRVDVQENISRRFFNEMPRHRQIVEEQKRQEALLDQISMTGYRIKQHVTKTTTGQEKVSQQIEKDMWSRVGRNDPCPCGSGKKFKDCHYRQIQEQIAATSTVREPVAQGRPGSKKTRRRR